MSECFRNIVVSIIVIAQMLFFGSWYLYEDGFYSKPVAEIDVKVVLYDPRDLLSGQYIVLNYDFSRVGGRWDAELNKNIVPKWSKKISNNVYESRNSAIWVTLRGDGEVYSPIDAGFVEPAELAEGDVVIKGRMQSVWRIVYGIEKYFVPEGTDEPNRDDLVVRLNLYEGGRVRIKEVYNKGVLWPQKMG